MKKPLIVLTGPTAAGKTHLSIALAKAVNGEIISADSMQVYKYMDIGSAKIRPEEMQGVKHYLVDELLPQEEFHIVKFQQMAKAAMKEIYAKGKIPVLVGGTGFYIQAITKDIDFTQAEQEDGYRQELEQLAAEKGNEYLHQMLLDVDPVSAGEIHANNVKRVIRALEFYHQNQSPISAHNQEQKEHETPYNQPYFCTFFHEASSPLLKILRNRLTIPRITHGISRLKITIVSINARIPMAIIIREKPIIKSPSAV